MDVVLIILLILLLGGGGGYYGLHSYGPMGGLLPLVLVVVLVVYLVNRGRV